MNTAPDISSFQYDKFSSGNIESSINMYRGAVCFDYKLVELAKHGNVGIAVTAAYNSDIDKYLTACNSIYPTGVMGLGWRLTYEKIEYSKSDMGKSFENKNYRVTTGDNSGGGEPLHLIDIKDGLLFFENEIYNYTETVYDTLNEIWTITDKTGVKYVYGGSDALEYAAAYGGRYTNSPCTDVSDMTSEIKAWNLREIISPYGNSVKYEYEFDEKQLYPNSPFYTKAAYIKKISDSYGNCVEFEYKDKLWSENNYELCEYTDPHGEDPNSAYNFYQSEYETKYLASLSVSNEYAFLYKIIFDYSIENYDASIQKNGNTAKRMLKSICMAMSDRSMPEMKFEYCGLNETNSGALKSILYPEGGTAKYSYTKNHYIDMTERTEFISNSAFSDAAKVFFGSDYAVIKQTNAGKAWVSIYRWIGRWQKYTPKTDLSTINPDTIKIYTSEYYSVITGTTFDGKRSKYAIFTKYRKIKGGWYASELETVKTAEIEAILGDKWLFIHDLHNDDVIYYYYDELNEQWVKDEFFDGSGKDGYFRRFSAAGNRLFCFAYDDGAGSGNLVKIYERNPLNEWKIISHLTADKIRLQGGSDGYCSIVFDGYFAAGAFVSNKNESNLRYTLGIWRLDKNGQLVNEITDTITLPVSEASYTTPRICGNSVMSAGYLYRFCGEQWSKCTKLGIKSPGTYQFSLSEDIAAASAIIGNNVNINGAVFDKCKNTWKTKCFFSGAVSDIPSCGVSVYGNIAVCGNSVYDTSGFSFGNVIERLGANCGTAHIFNNSACVVSSVYMKEEDKYVQQSSYIHTFENGTAKFKESDQYIFSENCGGSGNILCLEGNSGDIKLLFIGRGNPKGELSFYQASSAELCDGINTVTKTYTYNTQAASCDESGQYARYSLVASMNGNDHENRTVYRYVDSVSLISKHDNLTESSVADGTLISVDSYLNGRIDNSFTAEYKFADTVNGKKIYGNVLTGGIFKQITEIDNNNQGIVNITEFTADVLSGQRKEIVTYNYNAKGDKETRKSILAFAYEKYKEMKEQHRFTEVCEEILTINDTVVSKQITEYAYTDGFFSEKKVIRKDPLGFEDKLLYEVKARGGFANISAKKGIFPEYFVYDKNNFCRTASFTNAEYGECFAYAFEDYETKPSDSYENALITSSVCYAGTKCLEIKPKGHYLIKHRFKSSGNMYGFSFYAQCQGECMLKVNSKEKNISVPVHSERFDYNLVGLKNLEFNVGENAEIEFMFCNNSNESAFIDVITFFPLLNPPKINIYYLGGALLAASVSGYGNISEQIYDELGRTVCVVENKKVINCSVPSFSRETGKIVNSNISLKNAGDGIYLKQIPQNQKFLPELALSSSFFVNFFCSSDFQINISGNIEIERKGNLWTLKDSINNKRETVSDIGGKMITMLFSEIIALAADGNVIFSYGSKKILKPTLEITGKSDILNFSVGNEPTGGVTFCDGGGKIRQKHQLCGDKISVTAESYDLLGRSFASTIPTYIAEKDYLKYIDNYIENVDPVTGKMSGKAAEMNPQCQGYPYHSSVYEQRSSGRLIEKGTPCPEYAVNYNIGINDRHTVRTSYSNELKNIDEFKNLPPYYTVVTVLDPDNNEMKTVYDMNQEKIAEIVKCGNQSICTINFSEYKDSLLIKTVIMPNGNSKISKYDFTGKLVYSEDVNAGVKKYFYDEHGNLRFEKDSVNEKSKMCKYRLYDKLYRITEEGLFKSSLSDSELREKVSDGLFPDTDKIIGKRYYYDGDFSVNEIGMLTKIEIFGETEENEIVNTVTVASDKSKNTIVKTICIAGESYTAEYRYNNFGKLVEKKCTDGTVTSYDYDSSLRNSAVYNNGEPITETVYLADGLPERVKSCGNETTYSYDARNKVIGINSNFYSEKVKYLEGDKYFNGKIKSLESTINAESDTSKPSEIKYSLEYDECGRLLSAICENSPELSMTQIKYDKNGNILSCMNGDELKRFTIQKGTDKLVKAGDTEYRYDENGFVTDIEKENPVKIEYYSYSGLPKRFSSDNVTSEFLYDETGKRLKKTVFKDDKIDSTKIYLYDGIKLAEEIRNGKTFNYIYGLFGLNAVLCGENKYSVITDRLGYTRVVAECNEIIQAYHYKPFGEVVKIIEKSEIVSLLFGGYEFDGETKLYYGKSRLYDPSVYRFLSPDPEGEFASPYIYCGNDPFALIDENGETSWVAALIGMVVGIVLTISLSVLTLGTSAPLAVGIFGVGGTTLAELGTAKGIGILAYSIAMTASVAAVSGFASEGVKNLIDGQPFTASCAYEILLSSAVTGLVFGGAGTLISGAGRLAVDTADSALTKVGKYVAQGAALSLVNSGMQAASSPISDLINGNDADGMNVLSNAGFGALSGMITTFALAVSELKVSKPEEHLTNILKETLNDTIWAGGDPGVYYGAITEVVNSGSSEEVYDDYSIGAKSYACLNNQSEPLVMDNRKLAYSYSCFGNTNDAPANINSPRYFVTRGFGQKFV